MDKIQIKIINPQAIVEAEKMAVSMARLTQRGAKISSMEDFEDLIEMPYTEDRVETLCSMPHPTLQKFGLVNIAVIGASRRFLAQITRHQNEVKFMSGSLQYSDYSGKAQFCVPYEIMEYDTKHHQGLPVVADKYLEGCLRDLHEYEELVPLVGRDAAGYKMPQGMRNILVISARPFQWKHMISQRVCNRNSLETQYVLLRCWEELIRHSVMFKYCGPACVETNRCFEGKMSCGKVCYSYYADPREFLNFAFPLIGEVPVKISEGE